MAAPAKEHDRAIWPGDERGKFKALLDALTIAIAFEHLGCGFKDAPIAIDEADGDPFGDIALARVLAEIVMEGDIAALFSLDERRRREHRSGAKDEDALLFYSDFALKKER